jgi:hypothetical protein
MTSWSRSIVRHLQTSLPLRSEYFTGHQLRESLLRWLSPPDPSTTHNIACKARHDGTAQWFLQGGILNQWKSDGSFLWLYGIRASIKPFALRQFLTIFRFYSRLGEKCSLVRLLLTHAASWNSRCHSAPRSSKILWPYTTLDRPRWPISISISGMSINKNSTTCFVPFSFNSLLGLISAVTYSPDSILIAIMESGNPKTGL